MVNETGLNNFGFGSFLAQLDQVGWAVLLILIGMSALCWYVIFSKALQTALLRLRYAKVVRRFWEAASLADALEEVGRSPDPFSEMIRRAIGSHSHYRKQGTLKSLGDACNHSEFVTRSLRQVIQEGTTRLESGLTLLASVGSTAPFVGLFGTVWGIYHALIKVGAAGQATLGQVAGPVGEALIMTALGLGAAIPAVLAYNAFVRSNRIILTELDGFAHDMHAFLTTGSRIKDAAQAPGEERPSGNGTAMTREAAA